MLLRPSTLYTHLSKIDKYKDSTTEEHRIITSNGYYINIKTHKVDIVRHFVFNSTPTTPSEQITINENDYYLSEDEWIVDNNSNNNTVVYIPFPNERISVQVTKYQVLDTDFFYTIHKLNDKIIDSFFTLKFNQHLQQDFDKNISTFVSSLK